MALLTYSLTGEQHPYDPTTASFRDLRPANPLGTPGGWGAWEVKARYSNIDLDYPALRPRAANGGVAGGKQDVWTVGLNWYPNQRPSSFAAGLRQYPGQSRQRAGQRYLRQRHRAAQPDFLLKEQDR